MKGPGPRTPSLSASARRTAAWAVASAVGRQGGPPRGRSTTALYKSKTKKKVKITHCRPRAFFPILRQKGHPGRFFMRCITTNKALLV